MSSTNPIDNEQNNTTKHSTPNIRNKIWANGLMETTPCMMIGLHSALSSSNNSGHVTKIIASQKHHINSSPPGQNGHYVADNIFGCIFVNEKFCILITISLMFIPKGPINN